VLIASFAQPSSGPVAYRVLVRAEGLEHAQAVLVDVDSSARGAQPVGALVQPDAPAAPGERAGRGQSCETTADNFYFAFHLPQNTR